MSETQHVDQSAYGASELFNWQTYPDCVCDIWGLKQHSSLQQIDSGEFVLVRHL
jgi:hypothetical protein